MILTSSESDPGKKNASTSSRAKWPNTLWGNKNHSEWNEKNLCKYFSPIKHGPNVERQKKSHENLHIQIIFLPRLWLAMLRIFFFVMARNSFEA